MNERLLRVADIDLPDWRWVLGALRTRFATGTFSAGASFLADVARVADELDHHPDADLRYGHVRFVLRSHDVGGVTSRDVELARRISALAADRGFAARPETAQALEIALDTPKSAAVRPFWAAVLGAVDDGEDVVDPTGALPPFWFQDTDSDAPDRQRFHLDISVPPEVAAPRIAAAVTAGGRVVDKSHAPAFVVLSDPEGNLACVCTPLGRD
ncbi:MAG: 4a-hydroxytetrahydrobiopterin dehydratase [Arachnia sp.]